MKKRKNKPQTKRVADKNVRRDREIEDTARREMRSDQRDARDCRSYRDNDPAWYAQNPQLIRDYASIPFGYALGMQLPDSIIHDPGMDSIAGIMCLYFTPTIGVATQETDAINIAMRNVYAFVRHQNSGSANYDGPDLMIYLLAMDSCYAYLAWLKRLYGQCMLYSNYNRYYPKALIESEGVDFDDLQANLSNFRGFINQYAIKLNAMCIPASMSYMARHDWMCSHIYVDDPNTPKAQTYKYVPESLYQFALDESGAGSLKQYDIIAITQGGIIQANQRTVAQLIKQGNDLLNPIIANEDMNIMSGDILKAFGESGVVKVSGITENYVVLPEYSQEVLSQMENASILYGATSVSVKQTTAVGTGFLVSTPTCALQNVALTGAAPTESGQLNNESVRYAIAPFTGSKLLNFHHQDVSPEEVVVATRLVINGNPSTTKTGGYSAIGHQWLFDLTSCGSEVISEAMMWHLEFGSSGTEAVITSQAICTASYFGILNTDTAISAGSMMNQKLTRFFSMLSAFDWHPIVYVGDYGYKATGALYTNPTPIDPVGDISNYTTLSVENVANMNDLALLSEFTVPLAARGL